MLKLQQNFGMNGIILNTRRYIKNQIDTEKLLRFKLVEIERNELFEYKRFGISCSHRISRFIVIQ